MQLGLNNPLGESAVPVSPANHSSASKVPALGMESSVNSSRYSSRGGMSTPSTPNSAVPNAVYVNGLPNSTTEDQLREVRDLS